MKQALLTAEGTANSLGNARRSGNGWIVSCPVHEDETPSLSLTDREDGGVLVHCHAGCSQDDVIAALRQRGLWPEPPPRRTIKTVYQYR